MELIISFLVGAFASWVISHIYYRRSRADAQADAKASLVAQRLESMEAVHKTFIVALLNHPTPVPVFAQPLNWSGRLKSGSDASCASNGPTMWRFLYFHRLVSHHRTPKTPDYAQTFQFTERGLECAQYLRDREVAEAHFDIVGTDDAAKLCNAYGFPPKKNAA